GSVAMANLGFIGLGNMGGNMVARLLERGHRVIGYNRTRTKARWLIEKGMRWGDSPREVAARGGITFSMVSKSGARDSVADGPDGFLAGLVQSRVFIDMSTVSPAVSRALAERVRERGADMLDAPVSGSVLTLEQGKLSIMVGGRVETFARVKPVLE